MAASSDPTPAPAASVARWLLAFVAPVGSGPWWAALFPILLNLLGLGVAFVSVAAAFPPLVLLLWAIYQGLLAGFVARHGPQRLHWLRLPAALPLLVWLLFTILAVDVVRLTTDTGEPTLHKGEWIVASALLDTPDLGRELVIGCEDGGAAVVRVVGHAGARLTMALDGRMCSAGRCFPVAPLVLQELDGEREAAVEIVGGNAHLILPLSGVPTKGWSRRLPGRVPDDHVAIAPDNRTSAEFGTCSQGTVAIDEVLGTAAWVLYSPDWSRIGLEL